MSPRQFETALVVKRTFLELEQLESRDESKPTSGSLFRASSDPAIYKLACDGAVDECEHIERTTINDEIDHGEFMLTGLSDGEAETESTVSATDEPHTGSISSVSRYGSSTSISEEGGPLLSRSHSPCSSDDIDSCEDDCVATALNAALQPTIETLTNENARLLLENMKLRNQCLQVEKDGEPEAKAGKASPTYCETQETLPTHETQESRGSAHSHVAGPEPSNFMTSGMNCSTMACTTMPGALPNMGVPSADVNEYPRSDGVFPSMLLGAFVWVPMESSMPIDAQVFPMASKKTQNLAPGLWYGGSEGIEKQKAKHIPNERRIDALQCASARKPFPKSSFASTQPLQHESAVRSRRGESSARTEYAPLKHASVVGSRNMPKVQKSLVLSDIQVWREQHGYDLSQLPTTVMLRNLPNNYSPTMLLDLIDSEGFEKLYDFFYLPIDFTSEASLGYAFVNLTNHEHAKRFCDTFDGFSNWSLPSRKVCWVSWSGPHQGLDAHIDRYRNSPLMHETIPEIYKPAIFKDGQRVAFPPPTKRVRAPRIKRLGVRTGGPPGVLLAPEVQPQSALQQLQETDELSGDEQC